VDWSDTPEQAAFRASVREVVAERLPAYYRRRAELAGGESLDPVEAAGAAAAQALEAAGGAGFHRRAGLERLLRDVRAGQFHRSRGSSSCCSPAAARWGCRPPRPPKRRADTVGAGGVA